MADERQFLSLYNPVALDEVFGYFINDLEAIKTLRLVCKSWGDTLTGLWKRKGPVRLVQDEQLENPEYKIISVRRLLEDAEAKKHKERFIHQNFTLIRWILHEEHFLNPAGGEAGIILNRRFWEFCGANIRTLTLTRCILPYNFSVLPLDYWRAVPNLERLTLLDCKMELNTNKHFPQSNVHLARRQQITEATQRIRGINAELKKPGTVRRHKELTAALEEAQGALRDLNSEEPPVHISIPLSFQQECVKMAAEFQSDLKILSENPSKLKFLEIKNLQGWTYDVSIDWSQTNNIFPNLEKLVVRQQDGKTINIRHVSTLQKKLNEVNVLKYSNSVDTIKCPNLLELPTRGLSFDCGYETERDDVETILTRRPGGYEKLFLFRAPFGEPYPTFPCPKEFNLTELQILGNMARNLNFLRNIPNLKKLTWNTSCYDEETHAVRLHDTLGRRTYLLSSEDIIHNTDQLDANFVHENMESIQLENEPLSLGSLQMLGKWLPNLTAFKVTVVEDNQLVQIGTQWPNLKSLELAHGSSVTAGGILNAMLTHNLFQLIKSFNWKGCPCYRGVWGEQESRAVNELRRRCREAAIVPWKEPEQEASGTSPPAVEDCLRVLFERALPGEEENVRIFTDAFLRALVGQ